MRSIRWLTLVVMLLGSGLSLTPSTAVEGDSASTGTFSNSSAWIMGGLATPSYRYRVAIYRSSEVEESVRFVATRVNRWGFTGSGFLGRVDEAVTLPSTSLTIAPHPTRTGIEVLTFKAELPQLGSWDLSFSGILRDRPHEEFCWNWNVEGGTSNQNRPSYDSSIAGETGIEMQCAAWGSEGTAVFKYTDSF